jgi:photosystem II stability/assembly factor-like uncharacterized protein
MATNSITRIFAGAGSGEGKTQGMYRGGLFRRSPGEGDWQAVSHGLPGNAEVRTIAVSPHDSNVLFVGTQDGPYRSIDGGNRWEKLNFPDKNAVIWTMSVRQWRCIAAKTAATTGSACPRQNRRRIASVVALTRVPFGSPSTHPNPTICMWPLRSAA